MRIRNGKNGVGLRLQERRATLGLTQEDLAERSGLALSTVQKIELGTSQGRESTRKALADALETTVEYLVYAVGNPDKSKNETNILFYLSADTTLSETAKKYIRAIIECAKENSISCEKCGDYNGDNYVCAACTAKLETQLREVMAENSRLRAACNHAIGLLGDTDVARSIQEQLDLDLEEIRNVRKKPHEANRT